MGSLSSDETSDERCGTYSPNADVSEFETSTDFSVTPYHRSSGTSASSAKALVIWDSKLQKTSNDVSEVELLKERFAKLLLGEDMSGGGKGVCTALAISNAITNLSATVFGELWRIEPLAAQRKLMWRREIEWLLSVSDYIVELIPSVQEFPGGGGGTFEVMVSRPRSDLYMNLPALKKLDVMLLGMLDGFNDAEFWYVDHGIVVPNGEDNDGNGSYPSSSSFGRLSQRQEEKWWLPCPRVPVNGLSEESRKRLQQSRECANQILKAAMAINNGVLAEMEIPDAYLETLPKTGKSCLGEIIYRYLTADKFSPECLLDCLDLSSEHHTLEIADRIEAAIHVWRQKDRIKNLYQLKSKKTSWSGKMKGLASDSERSQLVAHRADMLLRSLRLRYPGLPQTVLDMSKIQYNKDVGQSILESYSRVMESLAFNIMARIDDLLYVDDATKKSLATGSSSLFNPRGLGCLPIQKRISPSPFSIQNTPYASPFGTPTFCSPTPVTGSPCRTHPSIGKEQQDGKSVKLMSSEMEVWSYTGNLSARKDAGEAPERD